VRSKLEIAAVVLGMALLNFLVMFGLFLLYPELLP
jgi:hypothetical protein